MNLSIHLRPEVRSQINDVLARRSVRRAIWIAAKAGLWLCYLALGAMAIYGFALWYVTGNFTYSMIPTMAGVWLAWDFIAPADWNEDEETTQPITPDS